MKNSHFCPGLKDNYTTKYCKEHEINIQSVLTGEKEKGEFCLQRQWHLSSVPLTCSVVSDSSRPSGLQHIRLPCPSPIPGACSNSCPSSQWCHTTISFPVIPFSCLQSFPASESFPVTEFFTLSDQSTGASASASVLPINIQDCFPSGWTGLISLQGLSTVFSKNMVQKHPFFSS